MIKRFLARGTLLSVLIITPLFAQSVPLGGTADLIEVSSTVVANTAGEARVVADDGSLRPYTLANVQANQHRHIVGKVNPATGQLVGPAAIDKQACDNSPLTPIGWFYKSCIGVTFYHAAQGENLVNLGVNLTRYDGDFACDASIGYRYSNVWRNINVLHIRIDPLATHCVDFINEQWYGYDGRDMNLPTNTRFHPTFSGYDDAWAGHPIVFLN